MNLKALIELSKSGRMYLAYDAEVGTLLPVIHLNETFVQYLSESYPNTIFFEEKLAWEESRG